MQKSSTELMSVERKSYGITYYLIENTLKTPGKPCFEHQKVLCTFDLLSEAEIMMRLFWNSFSEQTSR